MDDHGKVNALTAQVVKLLLDICDTREEAGHVILHTTEWVLQTHSLKTGCEHCSSSPPDDEATLKTILDRRRN